MIGHARSVSDCAGIVLRMATRSKASLLTFAAAPWWCDEDSLRLGDLPRVLPVTPSGRRVSIASIYRWTTAGLHGIRLRRFKVGGSWCTTKQELARWSSAITAAAEVVSA